MFSKDDIVRRSCQCSLYYLQRSIDSGIFVNNHLGEVSGLEASGEVEDGDELKIVDGASCLSVTLPGLRGYIPHFLNPDIMFTAVKACGHAIPTRLAIWSVVITRLGFSAFRFLHAL